MLETQPLPGFAEISRRWRQAREEAGLSLDAVCEKLAAVFDRSAESERQALARFEAEPVDISFRVIAEAALLTGCSLNWIAFGAEVSPRFQKGVLFERLALTSDEELQSLCKTLRISYRSLRGCTLNRSHYAVFEQCEISDRLSQLEAALRKLKPETFVERSIELPRLTLTAGAIASVPDLRLIHTASKRLAVEIERWVSFAMAWQKRNMLDETFSADLKNIASAGAAEDSRRPRLSSVMQLAVAAGVPLDWMAYSLWGSDPFGRRYVPPAAESGHAEINPWGLALDWSANSYLARGAGIRRVSGANCAFQRSARRLLANHSGLAAHVGVP